MLEAIEEATDEGGVTSEILVSGQNCWKQVQYQLLLHNVLITEVAHENANQTVVL